MPELLPDLSGAKVIAFDCETYDPDIANGPGFARGKGHVVGLAIGTDDGFRGYFPVRHTLGGNLNPDAVFKWAARELGRTNQAKIGHNVLYDLEALSCEGVEVKGPIFDTMLAEPLLNESKMSYSLDATAMTHLGEHKVDDALYKWAGLAYGGEPSRKQAANIYRCPVSLVGPYAEGDVDLPLRIFQKQRALLESQGLMELYEMECSLLPLLLAMRKRGVRVNVQQALQIQERLMKDIDVSKEMIRQVCRQDVDIWSAASIAKAFTAAGVHFSKTKNGAPSFTAAFLESCTHPLAKHLHQARKADKFLHTFIEGHILGSQVNGRIHCQFHPLRSDAGGTVSGRFSSSSPNLQNIPARDAELGPMMRALFIPEEGCKWFKDDYSQIEPRILLHYAEGDEADEMRSAYVHNKKTDFYTLMSETCGVTRRVSKGISLGSMYGMSAAKLADTLGLSLDEAQPLMDKYHTKLPFVKELSGRVMQAANNRGWIKTFLGRRARFDLWEPKDWSDKRPPLPMERAKAEYGEIRRARIHKALNALIQGSAADVMKKAMSEIWKAGICDVIGAPHLTVHDELDWSVDTTNKQHFDAHREALHIMENCVKLRIPLLCDSESGPSWGDVK